MSFSNKRTLKALREKKGNSIVLITAVTLGILLAIVLFSLNYANLIAGNRTHTTAIEAASLQAATDLSKIVMEDPNLGFVGLSDQPAIGSMTIAGDGEPLPVLGINTALATARLDLIIAKELNDGVMEVLAMEDVRNAKTAAANLITLLKSAVLPGGNTGARDINGTQIRPYENARSTYLANYTRSTGGAPVLNDFNLELGYLTDGGDTVTPIPQPTGLAQVSGAQMNNNYYKAFMNIPVGDVDFYFVGLSPQASLIDNNRFRAADDTCLPSIVKVFAEYNVQVNNAKGGSTSQSMQAIACAQPAGTNDSVQPGTMCLGFPNGAVPGITEVGDVTTNPQLRTNRTTLLSPQGNDWPGGGSLRIPTELFGGNPTISQTFSIGMYYWIREARTKPDIEVLKKLKKTKFEDLSQGSSEQVSYHGLIPHALASTQKSIIQVPVISTSGGTDDARLQAMLNNTAEGQRGFWNIAGYTAGQSQMPSNALLVGLTNDDQMLSADGKSNLDKNLITLFWNKVSQSNAAGLITMAVANEVVREAKEAINQNQSEQKNLTASIGQWQNDLRNDSSLDMHQQFMLQQQIQQANQKLLELTSQLTLHQNSLSAGQDALANGQAVAAQADAIVRNQRSLTAKGLSSTDDGKTFILAGATIYPRTLPPPTTDAIKNRTAPSNSSGPNNEDWTSKASLTLYKMPSLAQYPRNKSSSIFQAARAQSVVPTAANTMYLFEFNQKGNIVVTSLPTNPFNNLPVSENQLFAISYNAFTSQPTTAGALPITWEYTMRSFHWKRGRKQGGKHGGEDLPGNPFYNWCYKDEYGRQRRYNDLPSSSTTISAKELISGTLANVGGDNGNNGNSNAQGRARKNQRCGGMSMDMQFRVPVSGNCGFAMGSSPGATVIPGGSGVAILLSGQQLQIPGVGTVNVAAPGCPAGMSRQSTQTVSPSTGSVTNQCPPAPADLS